MTFRQWEYELRDILRDVPETELRSITDYYAEIYDDKREAGFSDADILAEFGTPKECASRIRSEGIEGVASKRPIKDAVSDTIASAKDRVKIPSGSGIAGLVLLTIFAIIPLAAVLVSLIAAFGSVSIGGGALAVGGAAGIGYSFIQLIGGYGFPIFLSSLGLSLAMIGTGIPLGIGFYYVTKYLSIGSYKLIRSIYVKKEKK